MGCPIEFCGAQSRGVAQSDSKADAARANAERVGHFNAPCLTIGSHIHKNMSMNCELFMAEEHTKKASQINKLQRVKAFDEWQVARGGDVLPATQLAVTSATYTLLQAATASRGQARLEEAFAKLDLASGKPCAQLRETEMEIETATKTQTETET